MKKLGASLLVCGLCSMVGAGVASAADGKFDVSGSGVVACTFGGPPITCNSAGSASGTLIGNGTFNQTSFVGFPPPCSTGTTPSNGSQNLTAAKGDQLFLNFAGNACQSGPSMYVSTGTYTITGGTGRFVGASGSGAFASRIDNPGFGSISFTDKGTINLAP